MKIVNNYDLIEKINDSKGKIHFLKIVLAYVIICIPFTGIFHALNLSSGIYEDLNINPKSYAIFWYITNILVSSVLKFFREKSQLNLTSSAANSQLLSLMTKLRESGIKTDLELLKDSKEDLVEYKFINEDAKLRLREDKYILVPTHDGFGGIKDVSVLQEHNVGSKTYVISLGSPRKCPRPVRVLN